MKKFFLFIALFLPLLMCGCGGEEPTPTPKDPNNIKVDARKALTGTFVEFFDKDNWEPSQWNNLLDEMKQIGLNTVIVQFAAFNDKVWYDGDNAFAPNKGKFALARLLAAAEQKQMDVYIGIFRTNPNQMLIIPMRKWRRSAICLSIKFQTDCIRLITNLFRLQLSGIAI